MKQKVVLKRLRKLNTIWHPDSKLVFNNIKEKKVIGFYDEDNEKLIKQLTESDVQTCLKYKFKYDETIVILEKEDSSGEEDGGGEQEEDGGEQEEDIKNILKMSNLLNDLQKTCIIKNQKINKLNKSYNDLLLKYEQIENKYNDLNNKFKLLKSLLN